MACEAGGTVRSWVRGEAGATAAEYALMAALIAMVIFVAVVALGRNLGESYDCTAEHMEQLRGDPGSVTC
jgi:Flp pilus assembly pilin Flp